MDGEAWWATVHGVANSQTWLRDFTFTFHFHALEKDMATHSSVLAWRIPETEEPGGLPPMGPHRVRHDWCDLAAAAAPLLDLTNSQSGISHLWDGDTYCWVVTLQPSSIGLLITVKRRKGNSKRSQCKTWVSRPCGQGSQGTEKKWYICPCQPFQL